ncbi:hypothetical protein [Streptomyces himalayensis]|uniref:hypothetical protein n=1 Tax=Streptomyces himalayensis TaxID=2820085 RepID=UPI001C66838E|nr:hypothetical protein [Streptomyces himalayensis]
MVVAPSTVEVVRSAGGWLFDQVMAGWDATVLTADHADPRPLRILGARAVDLECAMAAPVRGPGPQAIAVDADLYGLDARVRRMVREALEGGVADVRLWGDRCPADLNSGVGSVQHRLSVAARAFKAQALAAAAAPTGSIDVTEVFRSGELPHVPGTSDPEPAAL